MQFAHAVRQRVRHSAAEVSRPPAANCGDRREYHLLEVKNTDRPICESFAFAIASLARLGKAFSSLILFSCRRNRCLDDASAFASRAANCRESEGGRRRRNGDHSRPTASWQRTRNFPRARHGAQKLGDRRAPTGLAVYDAPVHSPEIVGPILTQWPCSKRWIWKWLITL